MPALGFLKKVLAITFALAIPLTLSTHAAVGSPIYGPFNPVFVGAEVGQFGFYAAVTPSGSFTTSFEGIDATQWKGTTEHNANPNGAVGPKQYAQWTQGGFQAYDKKTGASLLCQVKSVGAKCTNNVASPVSWGWFWSAATGSNVYECGHGSPSAGVLLYDQLDEITSVGAQGHGHWVIATHVIHNNHHYYCVAVSTASDITATNWNEYEFQLDGNGAGGQGGVLPYSSCTGTCVTGLYAPDYLKLGTSVEVKSSGTFLGGFYATWDLYSPPNTGSFVAGFEACALNRNDLVNGKSSTAMTCFYYLPPNNFPWGATSQSGQSVIHSLLPADFEGAAAPPPATPVEYFLATVNPYSGPLSADSPCVSAPCTSNQLALFTMGVNSTNPLTGPILIPVKPFTPGCYSTINVKNTYCVAQPTSGDVVDSIGDRLMHRLAYRYVKGSISSSEQVVVAQTVFDGTTNCSSKDSTPCTQIEWYKIVGPRRAKPSVYQGSITDSKNPGNFLFMPSVGANKLGNLQVTFEESGDGTHPSLYTVPVTFAKAGGIGASTEGTPQVIAAGKGDEQDSEVFGEYYSTTIDPCDDMTFWGTGEYFGKNETTTSGFAWQSRIYTTIVSTPTECTF
jgi:hypothetical protein